MGDALNVTSTPSQVTVTVQNRVSRSPHLRNSTRLTFGKSRRPGSRLVCRPYPAIVRNLVYKSTFAETSRRRGIIVTSTGVKEQERSSKADSLSSMLALVIVERNEQGSRLTLSLNRWSGGAGLGGPSRGG